MFRGLNGLRSGIKRHVGPTWIKKKKKQNKINISNQKTQEDDRGETFDFFFKFLFFQILFIRFSSF